MKPQQFRARLLHWFDQNKRQLPWRIGADPYAILVSEFMLQQTQVRTVIPYYIRFIRRFPNIDKLAAGSERTVLTLWSGLGYYRRAKQLHQTAKRIVKDFAGKIPSDVFTLKSLPGIGDYTAHAIASIAYGVPVAVVDGNVKRVLSRLLVIRGNLQTSSATKKLNQHAHELLAADHPGDFNQAMMELGALICTKAQPQCLSCPVSQFCAARRLGIVGKIPLVGPPGQIKKYEGVIIIAHNQNNQLLLTQDSPAPLNKNQQWNFPVIWQKSPTIALRKLSQQFQLRINSVSVQPPIHHSITTNRLKLTPVQIKCTASESKSWRTQIQLKKTPLSGLSLKAFRTRDKIK